MRLTISTLMSNAKPYFHEGAMSQLHRGSGSMKSPEIVKGALIFQINCWKKQICTLGSRQSSTEDVTERGLWHSFQRTVGPFVTMCSREHLRQLKRKMLNRVVKLT